MRVGDSLAYYPDFKINTAAFQVYVTPELGEAERFARYDPVSNLFSVDRDALRPQDVGTYMVKFEARYFNVTYQEDDANKFRGQFFLTVWADPIIVNYWFPTVYIEYNLWGGPIRDDTYLEPFDANQPVPFIANLSVRGVLTIAWDRSMSSPADYKRIPSSRVAVRSWAPPSRS